MTADWVTHVTEALLASSKLGTKAVQEVLPSSVVQQILEALYEQVKREATVVDVSCASTCSMTAASNSLLRLHNLQVAPAALHTPVVVVGDTHGQLHDVCSM